MIGLLGYLAAGYLILIALRGRLATPGAALAVGLAISALIGLFSVLATGGLMPLFVLLWAAPIVLLSLMIRWQRQGRLPAFGLPKPPKDPFDLMLFWVLIILNVMGLYIVAKLAVSTPILNFDALSYHIPLARAMASPEAGSVLAAPQTFYARMPLGAPILEAILVRGTPEAAFGLGIPMFVAMSIMLGAWSAARVTKWLGGRLFAQMLACAFYLLHLEMLKSLLNTVYDPLVALMAIAALELWLMAMGRGGRFPHAILAGVVVGTAGAMKLSSVGTALIPVGIVTLASLADGILQRRFKPRLVSFIGFAIAAVAVLAPWLLRAVLIGGHPLFPFRGEGPGWTPEQAAFVVAQHHPQSIFTPEYWSTLFEKTYVFGFPVVIIGSSAVLLTALVGAPLKRRLRGVVFAAIIGYLFFRTVTLNPDRFLLPSVAILIPAAALSSVGMVRDRTWRRVIVMLVITTAFQDSLGILGMAYGQKVLFFLGDRVDAVERLGGGSLLAQEAVDAAAPERVLVIFETRGALFPANSDPRTVWDVPAWAPQLKAAESVDDFHKRLREAGYANLFVNEYEWGRLIDFYARDRMPGEDRLMGTLSIRTALAADGLAAYPPFRFAGFDQRHLTILLDFLRSERRLAVNVASGRADAEVWYAPLNIEGNTNSE